MKEHNLKSHSFKGHADVFFNELKCYMKLSQKGEIYNGSTIDDNISVGTFRTNK